MSSIPRYELYFSTKMGDTYLGDSLDFLAGPSSDSMDLVCTTLPSALLRKKAYGNVAGSEYIEWFMQFALPADFTPAALGTVHPEEYPNRSFRTRHLLSGSV
jgi:hypothetical protein